MKNLNLQLLDEAINNMNIGVFFNYIDTYATDYDVEELVAYIISNEHYLFLDGLLMLYKKHYDNEYLQRVIDGFLSETKNKEAKKIIKKYVN